MATVSVGGHEIYCKIVFKTLDEYILYNASVKTGYLHTHGANTKYISFLNHFLIV